MTSGKPGSNPAKSFLCEECGRQFRRVIPPSGHAPQFCGIACRNRAIGRLHVAMLPPALCPKCGTRLGDRRSQFCRNCSRKGPKPGHTWTAEEDRIIRRHYALEAKEGIAKWLGLPEDLIRTRAYMLGVRLRASTRLRKTREASSKHMRLNNPAKRPEVQAKIAKWRQEHPQEHAAQMEKLFEGHRRIQKDKPTNLERSLFSHLELLGVEYEPFYLVKPKFIVDARIGQTIIQADGDYWHGHPRLGPLTPRQKAQRSRDRAQDAYLTRCGFTVIRIWEADMSLAKVAEVLGLDPSVIS